MENSINENSLKFNENMLCCYMSNARANIIHRKIQFFSKLNLISIKEFTKKYVFKTCFL